MVNGSWRALYPFESRYFDRGEGLRLHYIDEGKGDPVLMVHGNPTWSFYYRELAQALRAAGHRVIAVDHIGMGLSDKPGDDRYDYTLQSRVDDLDALMRQLNPGPATLVVHDWGGPIGLCWALRDPARLKALVISNTAGFLPGGYRLPWPLFLSRTPLGPLLLQGANLFSRGAVERCAARPLAGAIREGYLAPYDSWSHRLAVLRFVQDIPRREGDKAYRLMDELGRGLERLSGVPTLIAWGGRDFVFDGTFLAEWRRRLPKAEIREFRDAGHFLLEDAGPQLVPLIREFARKHVLL